MGRTVQKETSVMMLGLYELFVQYLADDAIERGVNLDPKDSNFNSFMVWLNSIYLKKNQNV